jgi:hypothetical protein
MIGQGQEHGRPKLSQVPYTGAEAVKKIFEQFSQMTASLNRFSVQLESIQDSAKHIAVEFHALAFQMRASRSLFSNDHQGGGQRSGLAGHFARSGGSGEEKSDAEILASFAMRENAKILIRKQLAAKNNVKDPTLNDDEILADYVTMLKRKSDASTKFYAEEKAKREAVDSSGMTQDQRDHIEYLKKKAQWTKAFNENPTFKNSKEAESEAKHLEYLKKKSQWTKAYNESKEVVAERNANEVKRNQENLAKYKAFLETKSDLYEKFQEAKRIANEKKKEEKDVQRKQDFPMPGNVDAYKQANGVNTYKKEQTESAGALNNYVEYLVAKEIEYRAHQKRLEAIRQTNKNNHKGDEKPLEPFNKRTYESFLDQPESLAEDINKFGEHYQKPLRSYVNYLTEKENVTAAHKKAMAAIKNADLSPRQKRQKEKEDAAEKEYEEKTKGLSKEEKAKVEPPEENNWYLKKLEQLKSYYLQRLGIEKWFKEAELALIAAGIDNKDNLFKTRRQKKQDARDSVYGVKDASATNTSAPVSTLTQSTQEALARGQKTLETENLVTKLIDANNDSDSNSDSNENLSSILLDLNNIGNLFKNKNVITIDAETISPPTAPVNSENHAIEAQIVQLSMIMKDALGKNLVEPLNIFIKADETLDLNKDSKFKDFNETYLKEDDAGNTLTPKNAAKRITDKIAEMLKKDPTATINRKGTYEDDLANANNDEVKNAMSKIVGNVDKRKDEIGSALYANVNTDYIIKQLIEIEKKHFKTSDLQTKLTKIALDQAKKREEKENRSGIVDSIKQQEASEDGKTIFTIEVQKEAFGIITEGTAHDASVDTEIQDQIFRALASQFQKLKSSITPPSENVSSIVKNLANDSGKTPDKNLISVVETVSSIIKKFYSGKDSSIQSINQKESDAELRINKGNKVVTDASYVEGVKNLLKTISDEMGINIYKIFDKIKISRSESIKGKDGEYQGRVGTKGEGDNLKQSLTLAIPDAAILGNDAEARAKVIALIMEEAFIHGLSNKIPALFAEGADLAQARGELQGAYGAISNQKSGDLAGAFDSGKYLSSFEELLAAVLKGIAGHDVSGLKDQNLPAGDFKYSIVAAIKNSLSGPMLAAAIVPMLMASMAGAGTLEDERAAGFVNKNNGVEGSVIGDPRARENFFQKGIEDRRKDKVPNAVELSIYADRERKAEEAAKPSSAVEDIKQIRAEKEKEAARVAALKKQKEDAKAAQLAGPPPTAEETAALEEKNQKEKEEKDKKEQAWLAAGGLYSQGGNLPLSSEIEKPKTLEDAIKNVVDTVVAIPAAIEQSSKNNPPLLRSANPNIPKGGIKGSTNVPPDSIISGSQAPFYSTAPTAKPTPALSLPTIPVNSKPTLTNKKPASIKEEKYVTFPMNVKNPLTSNLIKDADTYDTGKGKLRLNKGDAPEVAHGPGELNQPGGREAEDAARNILANAKKIEAKVLVDSEGKPKLDKYQRLLGDILVDGESLTEKLAAEGHLHVADIEGNEKPLSLMKGAARLKKGLFSKKSIDPSKWRKFTRAQKEAHIKDVESAGDIQTPNNTLNQPPSPAPTPSPMESEIATPEVSENPKEKPSSNFGRLIALALGTVGVAGATLFRVLNKKKKEKENNTPKDVAKPKPKVATAPPLSEDEIKEIDKAIAELEIELAPETSEPVIPPEKPISLPTNKESDEYSNFTEMIKHWGFQTLKDVLDEMKPSEKGYTLEEQEKRNTINSEIERRKNFKPGIPGTISKNINSDLVYIGENGNYYRYDEIHNEIDTRHSRSGDVDPDIAETPKIKPTDRNPLKPKNKNLKADLVNARIAFEKEKKLKDRAFLLKENQPPAEILAFENAEEELKNAQAAYDKSIENAAPVSTPSVEPTVTTPENTTPAPTREPARPSNKAAKFVPRRMGDGDLYGSAASQIQVPMELMKTPKVNAQLEKNHGAFNGMSAVDGLIGRSGGLNSHMILAGLMGHSVTDQAFKNKTYDFDPATVAYLLQKEVDNFTGADRGDLDKEVKPLNPTAIKRIDESGRRSLEQEQKKIEAYLKTMANPIFQKIARANLVIVQNQLNRLNDIKRSTAETTTEVKKDDDEPLIISEPSDATTEDAKDTKPEVTKNPDVTKEEKQEEKKEEAATKINAEAKQAIPRWREEVPAGWAEVLAETLNRYSGDAYADHDTIDVDSIVNAIPNTEETKEKKSKFRYDYEAMDTTGTEVKDSINASSEEEAQQKVKELGYALTKITKSNKPPVYEEPENNKPEDDSKEKEFYYNIINPNKDVNDFSREKEGHEYASSEKEAIQQIQKKYPEYEIKYIENTADDKPSKVLPQVETSIGVMGAAFGAAVGISFGTAAVGPIGGIIGSLIGGFLGKLGGGLLVNRFNNDRAERFEEREEEKKYRQEERNKKQKEDATDTPEIKEKRNEIELKEAQKYDLENMKSPENLEKELQAQKMSGAEISDAEIDVAVEKQKEAIEASADAIEKLKQELQALTEILSDLIKNKPAVDPEARSGRQTEHHFLGGFVGGKNSFPGKPKGLDQTPVWAQEGEYITAKKDVPYMMAALGAYKKRGVSHMARGGVVGGGSATITRPSGGSYSSGDIMGPFKDKLNDFVKNTRFGAFISNLTEASAKIQSFSQSMSGMTANASPDTFATFTGSIKLLSGAVGMALIPVFLRASQIIQTWAREIMNGTGTAGRLFSMFSNLVNSVLDGKFLALGVGIALLGAAVLPAIAFFGALVSGVSLLINGFAFFRAALLASSLMLRRGAAVPPVAPVAAGAATATAGAGAATAGAGAATAGAATAGAGAATAGAGAATAGAGAGAAGAAKAGGTFAKLLAGGGGAAMTGGILSGIVGGVSEGIENADIKSMSTGENVVRTGAQIAGAGGGALAGAMSGAWAGAALGSFVGPLGTAVGSAVGGLIGGALGSFGGSKVASGASNLAFGNKRRNEKDANGKPLPANDSKQQLSMAYQSSKSQSSYSSVEEAYKKIQVSALGDDPMTAELKKMNEHGLLNMLKELEKVNEGVRENKIPMGASS